jgi:ABC-type glycerol-3-phosphate transport system substrate-binding protein
MYRPSIPFVLLAGTVLGVFSCSLVTGGNRTVSLWTDRPEFAIYGEYFNTTQDEYKVEIRYFDSPAQKLAASKAHPDIVIGSWLKSASTRVYFKSLNSYFNSKVLSADAFYPGLLAMGKVGDRQYLLPVSFNAPVVVLARDKGERLSSPFTIGFDEMKRLGKDYNIERNGVYTRMGFSPLWNDNFLFITATLFNADFREADPLSWNTAALEQAMSFVYDWTHEINTNNQAEEDFTFKYFFDPPVKLALSGNILFTSMDSDDLFTLSGEHWENLDFRWIAEHNVIPLTEGSVYLGLPKKGKAGKAADAFVRWFFQEETQRLLLEKSKDNRMRETVFGISGGFSALRPVTEQVFPRFYPGLLGHMPPAEFLTPGNILPGNWTLLKEQIILPYLRSRARASERALPLERRLADWYRVNR